MNRLKFRAWNNQTYKMMLWKDIKSFKNLNKLLTLSFVDVMQFSGIYDGNKKQMYEGDIIKNGSRTMQLIFKQEACQFWLIWKDNEGINRYEPLTATYGDDTHYFSNDNLEVIGNVYQNPELIS